MKINPVFPVVFVVLVLTFAWLSYKYSHPGNSEDNLERILILDPRVPEGFDEEFNSGYKEGYLSFASQDMEDKGLVAFRYSSSEDSYEPSSESYKKGYVEGYHKATAEFSCPCFY